MKIDPYKHQQKYSNWKKRINGVVPDLTRENSDLLLKFLNDMEIGINVAKGSKKGARSPIRLNTIRSRMSYVMRVFYEKYNIEVITNATEEMFHEHFSKMASGEIKRQDGTNYLATADYIKTLKSFWHWWMKVNRKKNIDIKDLTTDLDTKKEKPDWVYLTEEQIKKLCNYAKFEYKVLIMFLYDTGIRAPTELMNIKVSDFYLDFKELNIRDEVSKTFGRRIKLMLSSELIKEYISSKKLGREDYLFKVMPWNVNRYLRSLAKKIFGDEVSQAGQKYSQLSMYDFRHCACCYWLPRYKSESALKYRFGWKKSDKIHYYSELLGMRDTISEGDLLLDTNKTELEKELIKTKNEKEMMQEQINDLQDKFSQVADMMKQLKIMGVNLQ
jgi:integrase